MHRAELLIPTMEGLTEDPPVPAIFESCNDYPLVKDSGCCRMTLVCSLVVIYRFVA